MPAAQQIKREEIDMLNRIIIIIALVVFASFFPALSTESLAMDREGCLTCHQYSGLVTQEKPGEYKVLHIDEDKYLQSSHGQVDCKKCHMEIKKVPHRGKTVVNCNTECHIDSSDGAVVTMSSYDTGADCATDCHITDNASIQFMEQYLHSFHKDEQNSISYLESNSSCRVCHTLYPHSKDPLARAIINMHAGFMICEVCHLRSNTQGRFKVCRNCHSSSQNVTYSWNMQENVEFAGEPFGTYSQNTDKENPMLRNIKSYLSTILKDYVPRKYLPKVNTETDYSISRIAVYSDQGRPLMNTWDTERALYYQKRKKNFSPEAQKRQLKTFHKDIAQVQISVACEECHTPDGIMDFSRLGFDKIMVNKLKNLNIKGLATKYKTFYFPNLFYTKDKKKTHK